MSDLYFEINPTKIEIIDGPKELEINWRNISGIYYLNPEELYDLSWAGYKDVGFIKISKENIDILSKYSIKPDLLTVIKSRFKQIVSTNKQNFEFQPLNINNEYSIQLTEKYKLLLMMKYLECCNNSNHKFQLLTLSGPVKFESKSYINFYNKIQNYIQRLIDVEIFLHKKIENSSNIKEILNAKLDINYKTLIKL